MPNSVTQTEEKFDLRTHATDPVTQQTSYINGYRLHILSGIRYFERPVNSGNLWFENNKPAGRLSYKVEDKAVKACVDGTAAHVAYVAPPSGAELIAGKLAQAETELAAIKAERDALLEKSAAAQTQKETKK